MSDTEDTPKETGKDTAQDRAKAQRFAAFSAEILKAIHSYGLMPVVGLIVAVTVYAIADLGMNTFHFSEVYSVGIAIAVAVLVLVHGGALLSKDGSNDTRAINGAFFAAWIVFAIAFLAAWSDSQFAKLNGGKHLLSAGMVNLGANLYQIAPALALFTSVASIVIPRVMSNPIITGRHESIRAALASLLEPLIIILVIATSAQHVLDYGQRFAGVSDLSAISAMAIAEFTFLVGEYYTLKQLKTARALGHVDIFDVAMWGAVTVGTLIYMMAVNVLYGQMATLVPPGLAGQALADAIEKAHKATADYQLVKDMYAGLPIIFGGVLFVVGALTHFINLRRELGTAPPQPKRRPVYSKTDPNGPKPNIPKTDPDDTGNGDTDKQAQPNNIGAEHTCQHCGKKFTGNSRAKYCSETCKQKAKRARHAANA